MAVSTSSPNHPELTRAVREYGVGEVEEVMMGLGWFCVGFFVSFVVSSTVTHHLIMLWQKRGK